LPVDDEANYQQEQPEREDNVKQSRTTGEM
jgi:hypothetical protein